jgi:hypothetical protein
MFFQLLSWLLIQIATVHGYNFAFESIQLTDADTQNYSKITFGSLETAFPSPSTSTTNCKVYPGDADWPSDSEWKTLNDTLGGVLIKGVPPASVCYQPYYNATQCAVVTANYYFGPMRNDNPVMIESEWLDGDSCPPTLVSNVTASASTCNFAAYPAYVVNATTVRREHSESLTSPARPITLIESAPASLSLAKRVQLLTCRQMFKWQSTSLETPTFVWS